jgi:hypothetical protein
MDGLLLLGKYQKTFNHDATTDTSSKRVVFVVAVVV